MRATQKLVESLYTLHLQRNNHCSPFLRIFPKSAEGTVAATTTERTQLVSSSQGPETKPTPQIQTRAHFNTAQNVWYVSPCHASQTSVRRNPLLVRRVYDEMFAKGTAMTMAGLSSQDFKPRRPQQHKPNLPRGQI